MVYEDGTARLNIDTTPDRNTDSYTLVKLRDVISVTGVTLSQSSASLREGEELQLTAAVVPDNADNRKVTWTSDDPGVASVTEDGVVTAVKAGHQSHYCGRRLDRILHRHRDMQPRHDRDRGKRTDLCGGRKYQVLDLQ